MFITTEVKVEIVLNSFIFIDPVLRFVYVVGRCRRRGEDLSQIKRHLTFTYKTGSMLDTCEGVNMQVKYFVVTYRHYVVKFFIYIWDGKLCSSSWTDSIIFNVGNWLNQITIITQDDIEPPDNDENVFTWWPYSNHEIDNSERSSHWICIGSCFLF